MSALERNLPAAVVVFPLLMGLLTAIVGKRGRAWWLALATTWTLLALAVWQTLKVLDEPTGYISYFFGDWAPRAVTGARGLVPIGIEDPVDLVNSLVLLIIAVIAATVTLFARESIKREIPADRRHFFYAVYLLCITGLLGITITGDAFNIYVLLEISSLTSYALVAMGKETDRRALTASFHYLLMGTVGASFLLLGIGYLFMVTGTLNMEDMSQQLAVHGVDRTVVTAFALIVVGLCLKMGLFPLHQWLPNAYTYAPSAVTALLASTATKVGIYVGLRFFFTIFRPAGIESDSANEVLVFFAAAAILFGSVRAIQQTSVKRLLAYSSVAQIGYMALGVALASTAGLTGTLLHMVNHALVKGALFLAVGAVFYRTGSVRLSSFRGLFRTMPVTATAICLAGLGLIGLPLTGGFVSKWYLVGGALEQGRWSVAAVVLIGSVLAVVYVLRVVEPMVFAHDEDTPQVSEAPITMLIPTYALIAGSFYCGMSGAGLKAVVEGAVSMLQGAP